jgi:hypothetical protein
MKETKTSMMATFLIAVLMAAIIVAAVISLQSVAKVGLEQTSCSTICITPEQFWQSFPG